jgi:hypothetical protein
MCAPRRHATIGGESRRSAVRRAFGHISRNVVAYLALFVALGGTGAYAANEWTGDNIVDGSLTGADVKNSSLTGSDVANESLTTSDLKNYTVSGGGLGNGDLRTGSVDGRAVVDGSLQNRDLSADSVNSATVADGSLTSADVENFSLGNGDLLTGSVDTRAVTDNSLTGSDIDESTLKMPPTTTATFAASSTAVGLGESFKKVLSKSLPAGSWAIVASANVRAFAFSYTGVMDVVCELRNGASYIGGATDRRVTPSAERTSATLSMNGGAQVPAGGGEVGLWCRAQDGNAYGEFEYGQMMMIRLDGFS